VHNQEKRVSLFFKSKSGKPIFDSPRSAPGFSFPISASIKAIICQLFCSIVCSGSCKGDCASCELEEIVKTQNLCMDSAEHCDVLEFRFAAPNPAPFFNNLDVCLSAVLKNVRQKIFASLSVNLICMVSCFRFWNQPP